MNQFQNVRSGQGLLKNSYGQDANRIDEQLQALQRRSSNLQQAVSASNPNPPTDAMAPATLPVVGKPVGARGAPGRMTPVHRR